MSVIEFPKKKLNKKKIIIVTIIILLLIFLLSFYIIYCTIPSFRKTVDIYILKKEVAYDKLPEIQYSSNEDHYFYSYDKYITMLNKKTLYTYNSYGEIISETEDINISTPIFANNNKFLVIAEKNGSNLYVISGTNLVWQNTLEGKISKISINKNGYVSVIISSTSYKSIVTTFDTKGNELFKTYISSNLAIATDISNDNKYLSIAEINYSGSIIKSMIKNISIEKAITDPTNSVVYTYTFNENELLTNIKYQDKNNLVCMTNEKIYMLNISDKIENTLIPVKSTYEFIDINLQNSIIYTYNNYLNFNNISYINILNTLNNSENIYEFNGTIKSISTNKDKIAINTGSEIHFIGLNGWLIKKFDSYSEINNIFLGDSIAAIIYKDCIKIIEI